MSSFVIDKRSYVRMCGALAGLSELKRCGSSQVFRLWNYSLGRPYSVDDFRKVAPWLFKLNAVSVARQYNDEEYKDPHEYAAEFNRYREIAKQKYMHGGREFERFVYQINHFFAAILYQIEDPDCERQAKGFLYRVSFLLSDVSATRQGIEFENWGEFEIA